MILQQVWQSCAIAMHTHNVRRMSVTVLSSEHLADTLRTVGAFTPVSTFLGASEKKFGLRNLIWSEKVSLPHR